ncbi:chromate transporter [Pectinatus haikarae]|uniref:Chromate transporter n=1 Tax=Pectinatus haikarae TaxID=349096 RepID=A0ABT9YAE5_9FIRM|nr:chromate transporter [Pectinatus haikarae]MDQ0204820.1 chromate transporter [Pectinatus haikarae]
MIIYWCLFFLTILKAVLFSTGGFGPLPSLHADFLANGWATEQQFAEAIAIGQIAPGPNGLWVVSLANLAGGMTGAVLGAIALILPPFFILLVRKFYARIRFYPSTQGILDGMVLVVSTFSIVVLATIYFNSSPDIILLFITAASAFLAYTKRISVNLILIISAAAGALFFH